MIQGMRYAAVDNSPIPFPTDRRPKRGHNMTAPDPITEILDRLAAMSDEIDQVADLVVQLAAREGRPRDG